MCSNGTFQAVAPSGGNPPHSKSVTPAIIVSGGKGVLVPTTFNMDGFSVTRAVGNPNATVTCSVPEFGITASGFQAPGSVRHNP
jgi:hypothetical protein